MQTPNTCQPLLIEGEVCRVDPIGRELNVYATGIAVSFDIPLGCPITLRGERVKLRLLQPRDCPGSPGWHRDRRARPALRPYTRTPRRGRGGAGPRILRPPGGQRTRTTRLAHRRIP